MGKIKYIDLFCGCGGLSFGFQSSGFECLLGVDNDRDSIETFKKNHPKSKVFCDDIHNLTEEKIKFILKDKIDNLSNIDLVIGAPPCQGFSTAGKNDREDPKRLLFLEFVRVVKLINPKVILFENVPGLGSTKNRNVLEKILSHFREIGYLVDAKVLSAEEYGVPQKRRRLIILAVRKDVGVPKFPKKMFGKGTNRNLLTVQDAFSNIKSNEKNHDIQRSKIKNYIEEARLSHIPTGKGIRYKRDEESFLPKELWFKVDWNNLREKRFRQTKLQRLDLNAPSFTILTSRTLYYHPKENRYLTVREAASLQSFPTYFDFIGSTTSCFKQIGNAVPVNLAMALARSVKYIILNKNNSDYEDFDIDLALKNIFSYKQKSNKEGQSET